MQQLSPTVGPADRRKLAEDTQHVLRVLRRGWRFPAVFVAAALTLAGIYLARAQTSYVASARLLVLQQGGRPLNVSGGAQAPQAEDTKESLATHVMIIRTPLIVGRAIAGLTAPTPSADTIIKRLKVTVPDEHAKILQIDYQSGSQDEAVEVVRAVIRSYDQFLKDTYQKQTNGVIALILNARDNLSGELRDLERKYLEFRQKNPSNTTDREGRTFLSRRLDQWDQASNQAVAREIHLHAQRDLVRKLAQEGAGIDMIANALEQLDGLGGQASDRPATREVDAAATPLERLGEELAEVKFQRQTAARLVEHLTAAGNAPPSRLAGDAEVQQAFAEEPQTRDLLDRIDAAEARLSTAVRLARRSGDPATVGARKKLDGLRADLDDLRKARVRGLRDQMGRGAGESGLREAESRLAVLRALESTLAERVKQARAEQLASLRDQEGALVAKYGEGAGEVRRVREQLARMDQPEAAAAADGSAPNDRQVRVLLASIERSLEALDSIQGDLRRRFEADLAATKKADIDQLAESNLRNDLERQRLLFHSIVDQLKQAQLISDYGSVSSQTITPPATTPIRPNLSLVLSAALLGGLGLGAGAAFLTDLFAARVHTLAELRLLLDLPVLGLVPRMPADQLATAGEPGLLCHNAPRSSLAESYKATRTNLESVRRARGAQVLLITSAHPGDGKSTTASNLAISLACAGRRVLLIDGDLRKPSLHRIHSLRSDFGLSDVLAEGGSPAAIVQPTVVRNLELIAAGGDAANPAELLASPRLGETLGVLRSSYDLIIIDSSPLLVVTDPAIIGASVDGILLVVRLEDTRRHDVERTTEQLRTLGVPVLGVIVNAITRDQLGFGPGRSTPYGYGYGYGYGRPNGDGSSRGGRGLTGSPGDEDAHALAASSRRPEASRPSS